MKVILLEDVVGAGGAGDVVEVKNGYARNKLLPSGVAIEASKTNMKTLEHRRAKIAAKRTADKEMAQALAVRIEGKQVDFTVKAGDSGKLFGSITAADITAAISAVLGFELDKRKLLLDAPVKIVGLHDVRYRVYPEVEATIKVNVLSEGAPILPPAEVLKDTYADADLEDEEAGEDEGSYVYDASEAAADVDSADAEDAEAAGAEADEDAWANA
ncbi:MAG: 50S ribosomal protein L9 [Clostridiales Family XIII bacterium]|jgi:large subunit ribosomal protein L9|nr:50S ribosomal protein L9 [Clostridiales Family XIII bacterium]